MLAFRGLVDLPIIIFCMMKIISLPMAFNYSLTVSATSMPVAPILSVVPPAYYACFVSSRGRHYLEGANSDGGPTPGSDPGAVTQDRPVEVRQLPKVKDNANDVMFYC